ncbi:uncharacterized protein LOC119989842 [Tripterygium wilfordii]|nr:uncharacterized protein LOC119989842 [Tripterygium wilfordii]XP_038691509.1 uncharacterized protein LOC119989842 [Tripterygium wilfordii]XP_038691511.1 uncharacterized protein LOC119989842 [Tripterygium wilfordii]
MALTLLMIIIVLHVTASALALVLASEESRTIALIGSDEYSNYTNCIYATNKWTPLRITALVLLLANQVLMMKASLWFFSAEKPLNPKTSSPTPWARFLLIICWAAFFITEAWFLVGSVRKAGQTKYGGTVFSSGFLICQTAKDGFFHRERVFHEGAVFILLISIASKMYNVFYVESNEKETVDGSDSTGENSELTQWFSLRRSIRRSGTWRFLQ